MLHVAWFSGELQRMGFNAKDAKNAKKGREMQGSREQLEGIASEVVDSCVAVHRELGAGLLEAVYQRCLTEELRDRGIVVECEVALPVRYKGRKLDVGYRVDMIVEDLVLVENKCLQNMLPIHEAQLLTYLRLSHRRLGFLVNWHVLLIRDGIKRMVLGL